ncbi:MAG: hypothetical protein II973_05770 [Spirochaetaceae bacterium]|nr:hypothetical protein [Spirochaetaceae bacterium]
MKKPLGVLFLLIAAFLLISCGGGGGGGGGATAPSTTSTNETTTTTSTSSSNSSSSTTPTPTYFGTKSPTEPKAFKDIVFSDGSATPYTSGLTLTDAQKNAAVAMIFYKGRGCSDNSSSRTLGVGLKPFRSVGSNYLVWCLDTANACYQNIDTIQVNVKNGSQNLEKMGSWLTAHSLIDDTGTPANYPVLYWAKNYGTSNGFTGDYATGWYLPSYTELGLVVRSEVFDVLDAIVELCNLPLKFSEPLPDVSSSYFSSTQGRNSNLEIPGIKFVSYDSDCTLSKKMGGCICAIREF